MTCERNLKRSRTYFQEREGEKQRFGIRDCFFDRPGYRAFVAHWGIEATNALKNWLEKHDVRRGQKGSLCFESSAGEEVTRAEVACTFEARHTYEDFITNKEENAAQLLALKLEELGIKRDQEGILSFEF